MFLKENIICSHIFYIYRVRQLKASKYQWALTWWWFSLLHCDLEVQLSALHISLMTFLQQPPYTFLFCQRPENANKDLFQKHGVKRSKSCGSICILQFTYILWEYFHDLALSDSSATDKFHKHLICLTLHTHLKLFTWTLFSYQVNQQNYENI